MPGYDNYYNQQNCNPVPQDACTPEVAPTYGCPCPCPCYPNPAACDPLALDTSNCCSGKNYAIDNSKLRAVCGNIDVIYDTVCAQGTPLVIQLQNVTEPEFVVEPFYSSCSSYAGCPVDDTSIFTVDSYKATIKSIQPVDPILPSDILVNGTPVLNVTDLGNRYVVTIDPASVDSNCEANGCGTQASVVISDIGPWELVMEMEFTGKVTTAEGTCRFRITFETASLIPIVSPTDVTFVANNLCIPPMNGTTGTMANLSFAVTACAQIINPILNIDAPGDPVNLSATLIITTSAPMQVTKNETVCFYGTVHS